MGVHVIFGAGQVGPHLAGILQRKGHRVRLIKRSSPAPMAGIETVFGDATDPAFCRSVTQDADAVYHCMNPAYSTQAWETLLPRLQDNLIDAAARSGARLIVLDNLYSVGLPKGLITEDTPHNPRSRKGEIRARLADALFAAHRAGKVRVASGRASDFYGPRGTMTHFADRFWKPVLAGKKASFLFPLDVPHTYHYLPDVAAGLAALGAGPEQHLGKEWMLPCDIGLSTQALIDRFGKVLGMPIRAGTMPQFAIALAGWMVPVVREIREMLHQWEGPFVVSDAAFRTAFGLEPTPRDVAAAETVAWGRGG